MTGEGPPPSPGQQKKVSPELRALLRRDASWVVEVGRGRAGSKCDGGREALRGGSGGGASIERRGN